MYGRGMMGYGGGEVDDGSLREALSSEVHDGVGDRGCFCSSWPVPPSTSSRFFPTIWAVPLVAPAFVAVARGPSRGSESRMRRDGVVVEESKERELLEALARAWGALARAGGVDFAHRRRGQPDALGSWQQRSRGSSSAREGWGTRSGSGTGVS